MTRGEVKTGDVALVGGAGPIGLLVAAMLKSLGAQTILTELSEARKAKALSSGAADYVLDPSSQDVKEEVLKLTDGIGADIGFECAGVNEVLADLKPFITGRIVLEDLVSECFTTLIERNDTAVKILVHP